MSEYLKLQIDLIPIDPWRDVLAQDLADIGFESFEHTETGLYGYAPKELIDITGLESLISNYSDRVEIVTHKEIVQKENWNKDWESNYDPIEVSGKIYVHASFHESKPNFEYNIQITPKMSFGTGHHSTTKLVLTEMLELDFEGKSVLDVGSGTGILSIFANLKGAIEIYAIDIEEWAVENAIENAEINKCKGLIVEKAVINDVIEKSYNVILANINYNVIMNDIKTYAKFLAPEGHILLSGFLTSQKDDLIQVAKEYGLSHLSNTNQGEWCMLHLTKNI